MLFKRHSITLFYFFILLFSSTVGYCFSDSNCDHYDAAKKETRIEISFKTFDNMIDKCKKDRNNLYYFLCELKEEIDYSIKHESKLMGLVFFYRKVNSKLYDCNIYYRFQDRSYKKLMPFTVADGNNCLEIASSAFTKLLLAKKQYYYPAVKDLTVQVIKYGMSPLIDPMSAEINMVVKRHPELEKNFVKKGVKFFDVPLPAVRYPREVFLKEFEPWVIEKHGRKHVAFKSAFGSFNPVIGYPGAEVMASLSKAKVIFPMPYAITKKMIEKSDLYKVRKNDTLRKIAKASYDNKNLWGLLYFLNKDNVTIPTALKLGMPLRIPSKDSLSLPDKFSFALFRQAYIP